MTRLLLIALCIWLLALPARADDDSALWMARCMVAEAGWTAVTDHLAIGYVLVRRWEWTRRRMALSEMVRRYCYGFKEPVAPTTRLAWVRSLNEEGTEPAGWPSREGSWKYIRKFWFEILQRARAIITYQLADPCHGMALHWGAPFKGTLPDYISCGKTLNHFYAVHAR